MGNFWSSIIPESDVEDPPDEYQVLIGTLIMVRADINDGNIENLRSLIAQLSKFLPFLTDDFPSLLSNRWFHDDDPFLGTSFIILACEKKRCDVLSYLLSPEADILCRIYSMVNSLSICDPSHEDSYRHSAFYYAIRSNCTKCLGTLINFWPRKDLSKNPEELEGFLAKPYEQLRLRNVEISPEMELYVEYRLMKFRFFGSQSPSRQQNISPTWIKAHFRYLMVLIADWIKSPEAPESDSTSTHHLQSIALYIHTLKRFVKPTYDIIPWEEVEFCIVIFLRSRRSNRGFFDSFYQSLISRATLRKYLISFHTYLHSVKDYIHSCSETFPNSNKLPLAERSVIVERIKTKNPAFERLYHDFEKCRDLRSLEIIKRYVDLAHSADPNEKTGQRVLMRVLTVIGEYLKNSFESPKMSTQTRRRLFFSSNKNISKIITILRNSLSHSIALSERIEVEKRPTFFVDLKNDLVRMNQVITAHLITVLMEILKTVIKDAIACQDHIKLRILLEPYRERKNHLLSIGLTKFSENQTLIELIDEFEIILSQSQNLPLHTMTILSSMKESISQISNTTSKWKSFLLALSTVNSVAAAMVNDMLPDSVASLNILKTELIGQLKDLNVEHNIINPNGDDDMKQMYDNFMDILEGLTFNAVFQNEFCFDKLHLIQLKMRNLINYDLGNVRAIEELHNTLKRPLPVAINTAKFLPQRKIVDKSDVKTEFYFKRLSECKKLLLDKGLSVGEENYAEKYKNDVELHLVLELLVLDILSVLSSSFDILSENQMSIGNISPLLLGKSIRNHLAHGNDIAEFFIRDPATSLLLNAQFLTLFDVHKREWTIGNNDFASVTSSRIITNRCIVEYQEKFFNSLKLGDLNEARHYMANGADLTATDVDSMSALHFAAMGSEDCLEFVLEMWEEPINIKNTFGQTALHIAASYKNIRCLEFLLEAGKCDPNETDTKGQTPLHIAASKGNAYIVRMLLDHGADPGRSNVSGRTPLQLAIVNRHLDCTDTILRHVNYKLVKTATFTPLHCAAEAGSVEIVTYLFNFRQDADINSVTELNATPLHLASISGHVDVVRILIRQGADLNMIDSNGISALHNAAEIGNIEIVDMLLQAGADPNIGSTDNGYTPIFQAAIKGNAEILYLLWKAGGMGNVTHVADGYTPLHWAAFGGHVEVIKLLLKMGSDPTKRNLSGSTPLHMSVGKGHFVASKLLINNGAPINIQDELGRSPIFYSAINKFANLTELLAKNRAYLDISDVEGMTPLLHSCVTGCAKVVEILIDMGSDVNASSFKSRTALHFAAERGATDIVKLLMANGADISMKDFSGSLPLHMAAFHGHTEIVSVLTEKYRKQLDCNATPLGVTPLHLACLCGKYDVAALLLARGYKIKSKSKDVPSFLYFAIKSKEARIVELLMAHNVPVAESDLLNAVEVGASDVIDILLKHSPDKSKDFKSDLLALACCRRQKHAAATIINNGADVNRWFSGKGPVLSIAAYLQYDEMVRLLLENGADPNKKCSEGQTTFHVAADSGNLTIVQDLLAYGSDMNTADNEGKTPLEVAVRRGKVDIFTALLNHDPAIDVNQRSKHKRVPLLHIAALSESLDMVKLLISKGADLDIQDERGEKAIHWAARWAQVEMVELFLSLGMDIQDVGENGYSLLHLATIGSKYCYEKCKYLIIDKCVDPNIKDFLGFTPLHSAAYKCTDLKVIKLMLENGAQYDVRTLESVTPMTMANEIAAPMLSLVQDLFTAVKRCDIPQVEKTLSQKVVVNVTNCGKETPLICATWKGSTEIVDMLLANNANPNLAGKSGSTSLHYACNNPRYRIVLSLLGNGAIFNLKNDGGKEPMDYAPKFSQAHFICDVIKKAFESLLVGDTKINILSEDCSLSIAECQAIFNCKNIDGKSLMAVAILYQSPIIEELKSSFAGESFHSEIKNLLKSGDVEAAFEIYRQIKKYNFEGYLRHSLMSVFIDITIATDIYSHQLYETAGEIFEDVCEALGEALGDDHEMTLRVRSFLALVLHREGRNEEAIKIFDGVLKLQKKLLEPTDPELLTTQTHMALVLDALKRYDEALETNYEVYNKHKVSLGIDDPQTLVVQNNIAMVLNNKGNSSEALKLYQMVYERRKKVLGPTHVSTLKTQSNIACVLMALKRFEEASVEYENVIKMQTNVSGDLDKDVILSKINAAYALFYQGQFVRALKMYDDVKKNIAWAPAGMGKEFCQFFEMVAKCSQKPIHGLVYTG